MDDSEDDIVVLDCSEEEMKEMESSYLKDTRAFLDSTLLYRIENWYQALAPHTFKSIFFELSAIEAYAIHLIYYQHQITPQIESVLENLKKRVSWIINENFQGGCFAKLSTRSPKDYSWDFRDPQVYQEVVQELAGILKQNGFGEIEGRKPTQLEWNTIYSSLLEIPKGRLRLTSGERLVKMFSQSERVVIDIGQLETAEGFLFRQFNKGVWTRKDMPLIKVCLREWRNFRWQSQFRCFYNNYTLTAITPYVQDVFYNINQQETKDRIQKFFNEIQPHLQQCKLSKGVMDICFIQDDTKLIQINTFDENSRGSLFSWNQDREIIENGPLTIRTLKECSPHLLSKLPTLMGMVQKGSLKVITESISRVNPTIDLTQIKQN